MSEVFSLKVLSTPEEYRCQMQVRVNRRLIRRIVTVAAGLWTFFRTG